MEVIPACQACFIVHSSETRSCVLERAEPAQEIFLEQRACDHQLKEGMGHICSPNSSNVESRISIASGSERGFPYKPRSLPLAVLITLPGLSGDVACLRESGLNVAICRPLEPVVS